jgi:hypothetical protein
VSLLVLYHRFNQKGRKNVVEKEPQATDYYATILADMEARRVALDTAIAGIRAAIAAGILGAFGELQAGSIAANVAPTPAGSAVDLPRGAFLGKTAREAIRLYLTTVRKKQTNKEISKALKDGGLESSGDFDKYITSSLFRLKEDGELLRFDDGWGLAEWYPESFRTKLGAAANNKKPAKRSKAKPKKVVKKDAAVQAQAPAPVQRPVLRVPTPAAPSPQPPGIDDRITEFLRVHTPDGFSVKDLAAAMGAQGGVVNFSLVRLVKKGVARRGDDGNYYAVKEP